MDNVTVVYLFSISTKHKPLEKMIMELCYLGISSSTVL